MYNLIGSWRLIMIAVWSEQFIEAVAFTDFHGQFCYCDTNSPMEVASIHCSKYQLYQLALKRACFPSDNFGQGSDSFSSFCTRNFTAL